MVGGRRARLWSSVTAGQTKPKTNEKLKNEAELANGSGHTFSRCCITSSLQTAATEYGGPDASWWRSNGHINLTSELSDKMEK